MMVFGLDCRDELIASHVVFIHGDDAQDSGSRRCREIASSAFFKSGAVVLQFFLALQQIEQ